MIQDLIYDLPKFELKNQVFILFSHFDFLSQGLLVFQQQKQKNNGGQMCRLKDYNFCASATSAYTTSYHLNSLSSSTTLNLEETRYIGKQMDIPEVKYYLCYYSRNNQCIHFTRILLGIYVKIDSSTNFVAITENNQIKVDFHLF